MTPRTRTAAALLVAAAVLGSASAPTLRQGRSAWGLAHVYHSGPADWVSATAPLIGFAALVGYQAFVRPRSRAMLFVLASYAGAVLANVLVWTQLVGFDPCYGDPGDECADIGGGPAKFLGTGGVTLWLITCAVTTVVVLVVARRATNDRRA